MTPFDRAQQTARRKAIYLELHPETAHGGDRKSDQVANLATRSFDKETAAVSGQSERVVRRDAERGEKVIPEVLEMIKGGASACVAGASHSPGRFRLNYHFRTGGLGSP